MEGAKYGAEEAAALDAAAIRGSKSGRPKGGPGRLAAVGVIAAVVLPIIAAYLVYQTGLGIPRGTVNQGELLIPPQQMADLELLSGSGEPLDFVGEKPIWRYVIVSSDGCTSECEKLLYTTRQVHIGLGDKAHRVERILVTDLPLAEPDRTRLAKQHPRMRFAVADSGKLNQWLAGSDHANLSFPAALLVDQQGYAMMVYDNSHSGKQLRKDIKRLLKYSYEA
ncbi:hypothetical protein [Microbulbifer aggregans]|uniref:hypothetical protein n=1 Tax=Microbulbifer aggregans TaxID=1769779 RepID=UPI001CFF3129|nr:hypothetical protein [Microbulbifer aggregans]